MTISLVSIIAIYPDKQEARQIRILVRKSIQKGSRWLNRLVGFIVLVLSEIFVAFAAHIAKIATLQVAS